MHLVKSKRFERNKLTWIRFPHHIHVQQTPARKQQKSWR